MGTFQRGTGVIAHGFADAGAFPVPMPVLLLLAAGVVAAATAIPARRDAAARPVISAVGPRFALVLQAITVFVVVAIALPAAFGRADAAANPAPRLLFTVGWAGLLLVSAMVGPVWARANPLRRFATDGDTVRPMADFVGVWPAVIALALFSLAEQLYADSTLVALVVIGVYIVATAGGAVVYGRSWFTAVDPLDVASRLLGRLAVVGRRGRSVTLRNVRAGVRSARSRPGTAAFGGLLIGVSLYDAWAVEGVPGPPLVVFTLVTAAAVGTFVAAARPTWVAPAVIPAAAGHVGAHYLAPLLVDTQTAAVQASDPFDLRWNLLGLTGTEIVAEPIPATVGMTVQLLLLAGGHALAMVVAKDLAAPRLARRALAATLFPLRAALLVSLVAGIYLRLGGL